MGIVKRYSSEFHIAVMDGIILLFTALIVLAGAYEIEFLSELKGQVFKKDVTWLQYSANGLPVIVGSICAMALFPFLQHCKSKISAGGAEISPLEIVIIFSFLIVMIIAPVVMFYRCKDALDKVMELKLFTVAQYDLKLGELKWQIILNILVELFLGLLSTYELATHNNKLKTVKIGKAKLKNNQDKDKDKDKTNQKEEDNKKVEEKEKEEDKDKTKEKDTTKSIIPVKK